MIVTTTHSVVGRRIAACRGIVVGEAILWADIERDLFAGVTDVFGGRSGANEEDLGKARATALSEMGAQAPGADAIMGGDLDCEVIISMPMVSSSGTAVSTEASS